MLNRPQAAKLNPAVQIVGLVPASPPLVASRLAFRTIDQVGVCLQGWCQPRPCETQQSHNWFSL